MKFLVDEMYSERVAELLCERGHDAVHARGIGLGGARDADVLARAVENGRTVATENAADFVPLLDQRHGAGVPTTPVLIALTTGRGVGGALHARLAADIDRWARSQGDPYAHVHWLP
jgi:predicted nuclease of predicted toxin-antitoxin system